jgi:hypothetical protein
VTSAEALRDEERRARHVRIIANFTTSVIAQGDVSRAEAEALVAAARKRILELFPGREETYEIIYGRRFERLLDECVPVDPGPRGIVIPFPEVHER